MPSMMTGAEVAALLRLNIKTVRKYVPSVKVGKRVLYAFPEVQKFLAGTTATQADDGPVFPYGVKIENGPFGRTELPIALVAQRRLSTNGKTETWIIECPRCGELHEHGAGEGSRASHCGLQVPERGEIYILDATHLPLTPFKLARIQTGRRKYI
ncbi:helix-turn-helix domain-containing protein [Methylobacterium iners]|uniref:Helix-turn-helix domain-containing protein n=1 Tax=Methylobacterium iners TaxID=418707 RepID=A0ABQ4S4I6_9HYPH|nr:helix-turn-helix domain-containing protein [Methylobacterium iners]GJD96600.1 hypothetical protein OCOJLMKI_3823 [Methylobacterium iners]